MERGQASAEYVGLVALVALALGLAGAVAVPDLAPTLARHVRVALCIVGGDVCRAADARAAGLEPCVTRVREGSDRWRVNVAVLAYGRGTWFAIERRSDGSSRVSVAETNDGGLVAGVGFRLGAHVRAGAEASGAAGWSSGYAWELPDAAALRRFLRGVRQSPGKMAWDLVIKRAGPPAERFRGVSTQAGLEAGARVLGLEQPLVGARGRGVLGRRTRGGRSSWYFDASHDGPHLLGGLLGEVAVGRPGAWVLELEERPRALRLHTSLPPSGDRQTELEARLDLEDPANAAVVRDLLARPSPERARAIGRHVAEHGVVERRTYRTRTVRSDPAVAVALGVAGAEHSGDVRERTLVAAEVLRGGGAARRADCLGL